MKGQAIMGVTQRSHFTRRFLSICGVVIAIGLLSAACTHAEDGCQAHQPASSIDTLSEFVPLLKHSLPQESALLQTVATLLAEPPARAVSTPPLMMVIFYRHRDGRIADVVVQLFRDTQIEGPPLLNPDGLVRSRLGEDLFSSADSLMGLMYKHVTYLGHPKTIESTRRALEGALGGDLTYLRELTVEPLYVVIVVPHAGPYLPGSLKTRVRSVVSKSKLTFNEWKNEVSFFTDNNETAEQVGLVMAAWRDMAKSMADTFASHVSGQPLRDALEQSAVRVENNQVVAAAAVPAATVVRATKELAGHGGGCPPGTPCRNNKVPICHIPPGNPGGARTICVAPSAVPAHLAHGDYCGPCITD